MLPTMNHPGTVSICKNLSSLPPLAWSGGPRAHKGPKDPMCPGGWWWWTLKATL